MNKMTSKLLFLLFCSGLMLLGCSSKAPPDLVYKVVEDESKRKIKRRVTVELDVRTDKATLGELSTYLRDDMGQGYNRFDLLYRIRGAHENTSAWATSEFDPELSTVIYGAEIDKYERIIKEPNPPGEIIGVWMSAWGTDYKIAIYTSGGKAFIRETYDTDSSNTDEVVLSATPRGVNVRMADDLGGREFQLVNGAGDLEYWSENGNYYTAPAL